VKGIRVKRLYKDNFDKKLGGVCGGLAQYFQVDSSLIRLIAVALTLVSFGITFLVYLVLWGVLPKGPRAYIQASYKRLYRSRRNRILAGVCGGLGTYFKINPDILRLIFVVLLFVTVFIPVFVFYVAAAFIIPEEP
jgi:phage shock protein PspC (stress-responsive transcriptional regulator)